MSRMTKLALKISGMYLLVGALWILFSDAALSSLVTDMRLYVQMQILKGWFFILVTSAILFISVKISSTDHFRARSALEMEREMTSRLMDTSPVGITFVNKEGRITFANQRAAEVLGVTRDEIMHRTFNAPEWNITAFDGSPLPEEQIPFNRVMAAGQPLRDLRHAIVRPNGRTTFLSINATPYYGKTGVLEGVIATFEDITERERADAELRRKEGLLRLLVENSPAAIAMLDNEMKYIITSRRFLKDYKLGDQDLVGRSHYEVFPEITDRWREIHRRCLNGTIEKAEEDPFPRSDGSLDWVRWEIHPWYEQDGKVGGIIIFSEVLTDRKRSEDRFRSVVEFSPIAMVTVDSRGTIQLVNPQAEKLFGYSPNELIGAGIERLLPEGARAKHEELRNGFMSQAESRKMGIGRDLYGQRKDGSEFPAEIGLTPIEAVDGKMVLCSIIDITQRRRSEQALLDSELQYRRLFEANPHPMWFFDPSTLAFLEVNEAAIQHYGYSREEFLSMTIKDIRPPEEVAMLLDDLAQDHGGVDNSGEWRHTKRDGSIIHVQIASHEIQYQGRPAKVVLAHDITERKRAEENLEVANNQLRQAQKLESLGTLAGGIAHDFNNILGIIMGHGTLIKRGKSDPERIAKSAEVIEQSAQRGASLVRQLLTFARKTDVALDSVFVNDIIKEVVNLLEETFPKVITISTTLQAWLPSIMADSTQVHQVLMNLCVNARDAMMPKGGELNITTELLTGDVVRKSFLEADALEYTLLSISDTGSGMDEATRKKIFEPFFTTKAKGKGTGLGLATVYGIVEGHKGFIDVVSEVGQGTTFRVFFPVAPRDIQIKDMPGVSVAEIDGGTESILVVEDEELLRVLATSILELKGYRVRCACDGLEALSLYSQNNADIDLVLTDLGLPKIDGEALILGLKEINPSVRIIVVSGYVEPEQRSRLFRSGAMELISKPFRPDELLKKVREVLDL